MRRSKGPAAVAPPIRNEKWPPEPVFSQQPLQWAGMPAQLLEAADSQAALRQELSRHGVGIECRKGRAPTTPNSNAVLYCKVGEFAACGIAHGHGDNGHWAAEWAAQCALSLLFTEVLTPTAPSATGGGSRLPHEHTMHRIFNIVHDALYYRADALGYDLAEGGCTLTLCVTQLTTGAVQAAWVGDALCVLGDAAGVGMEVLTSIDDFSIEKSRPLRGLHQLDSAITTNPAISRKLGYKAIQEHGGSHDPCIRHLRLKEKGKGQFLLCASNGVWEMLTHRQAAEVVAREGRAGVSRGVGALAEAARNMWSEDETDETEDISIIAVWF